MFLHTAQAHLERFDRLASALDVPLTHVVKPNFLARAQSGISSELRKDIHAFLQDQNGLVMCTCTTIGPVAQEVGALRVDQPMMEEAARIGGKIMLAYAIQSTLKPSYDLMQACITRHAKKADIEALDLCHHWPLFEAGKTAEFDRAIARDIRTKLQDNLAVSSVVLAQVSMAGAGAGAHLMDLGIPVLNSPQWAMHHLCNKL